MKQVILIAGSFTSANFNVMLDVIRSLGEDDIMIHAISANNDPQWMITEYKDVKYYPVFNNYLDLWGRKNKSLPLKVFSLFQFNVHRISCNFWQDAVERKIKKQCEEIISHNNIYAVFSVSLQFYTHRVAYSLIKHNPLIKWYPFWLDAYYDIQVKGFISRCMKHAERTNLRHAPHIYSLLETFKGNDVIEPFKSKVTYIEFPYIINRKIEQKNKDIIFAGSFYKNIRNPEPVFDLLFSILHRLQPGVKFKFYVRNHDTYTHYAEESKGKIEIHDFVSRKELSKILSTSYMLLNVGNTNTTQQPSKVLEYISYRKPILFFFTDEDDSSFRFFKGYPDVCNINVKGDKKENADHLVDFINSEHEEIKYEDIIKESELKKCTPEYLKSIIDF